MRKRTLSIIAASIICMAGCSADTVGSQEPNKETESSMNQTVEDSSIPDTSEEESSSEETAQNTEQTEDVSSTDEEIESSETEPVEREDIFGLDGSRNYIMRVESFPDYVHSADEWLSEDGKLEIPFDFKEMSEQDGGNQYTFTRYYIPEEALQAAATKDLVKVCVDSFFATQVIAFERLDLQVQAMASNLNAVDTLFGRDDFAEALIESYKEDTLLCQKTYSDEASADACAVINEELFLARNEVFDQMTDEMREETLSEVIKKLELIESGEYYYCDFPGSCFFYYVGDLYSDGDGNWYEYLEETHPEYLQYCEHSYNYR